MPKVNPGEAKRLAAKKALELVRPGMRLGLGTGSTAECFIELLGTRVGQGLDVLCVPTSERTRTLAEMLAIPLTTLDATPELDLTVDGADEFDQKLRLIKGGGGALLREKITAAASKRMIVIADQSKSVKILGKFPLAVAVNQFGLEVTRRRILAEAAACGCEGDAKLRKDAGGEPFITDDGHYIVDCFFGAIPEPEALAAKLAFIPGVMEHGLFIGMAKGVIVGGPGGAGVIGALD
jgi:ribose 5-phosphate isomerase A